MNLIKMNSYINTIRTSAYLLICTLLFSCAQIVAPGGGAKDTTPPKVLKFIPDSAQLNFNSKSIYIEFDEFIALKDLNSQLLISPPLAKTPEATIKNKSLTIQLDKNETLKPNTTYCISFGNAVQDLNENNAIENFQYIFSTGTFIDSLKLKGKVQNAFNQSTEKGIGVMLYSDLNDSVVYKSQPDYFAKTDKDGIFQINNIKAGKYKLVAIKDANNNYKYEGESESIGFVDAAIDVSEKQTILIDLFQEPAKKVYLKKYIHDSYGKVSFFFNEGSDSLRVQPLNNDQKGVQEYLEFSKNNDTLTYWIKNFIKDSLILQVSNGNKVLDTVSLKFISREDAEKSKKNPLKLKVVSSPNGNQSFDLGGELKIKMSNTLSTDIFEAILKEDTVSRKVTMLMQNSILTLAVLGDSAMVEDNRHDPAGGLKPIAVYESYDKWKENTKYELLILPNSFTDFFGLANDSIKVNFKTHEEKYYGSVKLNLYALPSDYIVQLLDEAGVVVRENFFSKPKNIASPNKIIEYSYLAPKKYKLKIIYDDNRNHKWDTGNYLKKIQPEKVIYNSELINIRSNWDAELEWKVD